MRVSEFLRGLADMVAKQEAGTAPQDVQHQDNDAGMQKVAVDNVDHTESNTMVPPLQQKMELLKKAAGVDSIYDKECADGEVDPLEQLKKQAGIANPVTVFTAGEDNDVFE